MDEIRSGAANQDADVLARRNAYPFHAGGVAERIIGR